MFIPDDLYSAIGENIHRIRILTGISQEDLANQVGLARTSITNIEMGKQKIQIHTLYQIAQILSVGISELLPAPEPSSQDLHQLLEKQEIISKHGKQVLREEDKEVVLRMIGNITSKGGR
jgi:transcriptional regulator with XRE-family HTH domain